MNPWIIGGAAAGVALLGYGLIRKANAKPVQTPEEKAAALKKAYDAGSIDGTADGTADAGKLHNPRGLLNYSDMPDLQTQYDNGYNDGYEKKWTAPVATPDVVKDSTPSAGGKPGGEDAFAYGCSRGKSSGWNDRVKNYSRDSYETNLASDGSKKRQAESGNPARYRAGYIQCYKEAWDSADLEAEWGTISITGFARPASFRPIQREQLWSGGQRISAVSGFGDRYRRFSDKLLAKLTPGQSHSTSTAGT